MKVVLLYSFKGDNKEHLIIFEMKEDKTYNFTKATELAMRKIGQNHGTWAVENIVKFSLNLEEDENESKK